MDELLDELKSALAGRYEVQREIGAGGMATVFMATDIRHQRSVAIKVLHPDLAATQGSERFLREVRLAAGHTHPNILPVLDLRRVRGARAAHMVRFALHRGGEPPGEATEGKATPGRGSRSHRHRVIPHLE